jgi:hypothetical protein
MSASLLQIKRSRKANKDPKRVKKAPNAYIEYSTANNVKVRGQLAKKNPNWTVQQLFEATGTKMAENWEKYKAKNSVKSSVNDSVKKSVKKSAVKGYKRALKNQRAPTNRQKISLESLLRYY